MADLPDFQTETVNADVIATNFRSGLDADKPAAPSAGDIWLARDTYYLYVCFTAGVWEKVSKLYLPLAGGTMSGAIAMGASKITGLGAPAAAADAARKAEVDAVNTRIDALDYAFAPIRALDTIYQNGAKLRYVCVVIDIEIVTSDNSTLDGYSFGDLQAAVGSPPLVGIDAYYQRCEDVSIVGAGDLMRFRVNVSGFIPPNYYYRVTQTDIGDATSSLTNWIEVDFF